MWGYGGGVLVENSVGRPCSKIRNRDCSRNFRGGAAVGDTHQPSNNSGISVVGQLPRTSFGMLANSPI